MPDKNPGSDRWGGSGAGHENAKKGRPDPIAQDLDAHRARDANRKNDIQASNVEKKKH